VAASLLVESALVRSGLSPASAARSTQDIRPGTASSAAVERIARTPRLSPGVPGERYAGFPRPPRDSAGSPTPPLYAASGRDTAAHAARCAVCHGIGATP